MRVVAPATSANLGPGFDVLGVAWPLANAFELSPSEADAVQASGPYGPELPKDPSGHAAWRAVRRLEAELGLAPRPWRLEVEAQVPPARGLGSSASAVVGGLVAANEALGGGLDLEALLGLAVELEGHADNAAACLWGGVVAALPRGRGWGALVLAERWPWGAVVVAPAYGLPTVEARAALPEAWPRDEVVANLAAVTALTHSLATGSVEWLGLALQDRLHQGRRAPLMPGADAVQAAGRQAGAHGVVVSGAGPTHLALAPHELLPEVEAAMVAAYAQAGIASRAWRFDAPAPGARRLPPPSA